MALAPRHTTPMQRFLGAVKLGKQILNMSSPDYGVGSSYPTPLVALSSGGQTGATLCQYDLNYVGTTAADHDSVMLPPSEIGRMVVIANGGGHILDVYGNTADASSGTINGTAGTTPKSTNANTVLIFWCVGVGIWVAK